MWHTWTQTMCTAKERETEKQREQFLNKLGLKVTKTKSELSQHPHLSGLVRFLDSRRLLCSKSCYCAPCITLVNMLRWVMMHVRTFVLIIFIVYNTCKHMWHT